MTDEQCLKAVVEENCCAAFAALMQRYYQQVYVICLRRLRNTADAEDATQEVFRKLLERPEAIDRDLGGWLGRCAANTSVSMIRSDSARRRREASVTTPGVDPEKTIELLDRSEIVSRMLRELDAHQRDLLIRHVVQGESQTSLAKEMGVTQQAVASRITTIRRRLQTWLVERRLMSVGLSWLVTGCWTPAKAAALRVASTLGMTTGGGGIGLATGVSAGKGTVATAVTVGLICLIPGDDPATSTHRSSQSRAGQQIVSTSSDVDSTPAGQDSQASFSGRSIAMIQPDVNTAGSNRSLNIVLAVNQAYPVYTQAITNPLQYNAADPGDLRLDESANASATPGAMQSEPIPMPVLDDLPSPQPLALMLSKGPTKTVRAESRPAFGIEASQQPERQHIMPETAVVLALVKKSQNQPDNDSPDPPPQSDPSQNHHPYRYGSWMPDTLTHRPGQFGGSRPALERWRSRRADLPGMIKAALQSRFNLDTDGERDTSSLTHNEVTERDKDRNGPDRKSMTTRNQNPMPDKIADRIRVSDMRYPESDPPSVPDVLAMMPGLTEGAQVKNRSALREIFTQIMDDTDTDALADVIQERLLQNATKQAVARRLDLDEVRDIHSRLEIGSEPSLLPTIETLTSNATALFQGRTLRSTSRSSPERHAANQASSFALPEPTSLVLMSLGAILLARRPQSAQ